MLASVCPTSLSSATAAPCRLSSRQAARVVQPGRLTTCCSTAGKGATHIGVNPAAPSRLPQLPPWYISVPAGLVALVGLTQIAKKVLGRGSLNSLESRGYLDDSRNNKDPFDKGTSGDVMKGIRTMQIEPLSEEQIAAARRRRSQERKADELDLSKVELPDNHPWAVKEDVTADDEELAKARLNIRRGAPLQDLSGKRGYDGV